MSNVMQFYRIAELTKLLGIPKSTLKDAVRKGQFPPPIRLTDTGRAIAWTSEDVTAWQQHRMARRIGRAK